MKKKPHYLLVVSNLMEKFKSSTMVTTDKINKGENFKVSNIKIIMKTATL